MRSPIRVKCLIGTVMRVIWPNQKPRCEKSPGQEASQPGKDQGQISV